MRISVIILFASLFFNFASFSQSDKAYEKDQKKIGACIKVFNKKGYQKGIDKLMKYMDKQMEKDLAGYPSLSAYETLVKMEYMRYERDKDMFAGIEITVESDDEEDTELDSLTRVFIQTLKDYPLNFFLDVCRRATMESQSYTADIYLRTFLVDYNPDTLVTDEAWEYFNDAEDFFFKKDYELAELNYRKALNEDSSFYKALLYLGDTFWAKDDFDSAIVYYTKAKTQHPQLLEPRKYIVDALMEQGLYYRAKKECLDAFTIYPGFGMKLRLQKILYIENKYMDDRRFIRYFYPNDMRVEDQRNLSGVWNAYRKAKYKISRYCNEDGIIEENGETEDKYLEVYSYRQMLTKYEDDLPSYLKFAYKMMEEGYLECYVFISLFHVDIYPQFKDYMSYEENREKSKEFVEKYLIEDY